MILSKVSYIEQSIPGPRWEGWFVRSNGSVRKPSGLITFGWPTPDGHYRVMNGYRFDGRRAYFYIHRLVAHAFVHNPRPDIFVEVDHIDRNPRNNDVSNLRWLTHQLNLMNNDGVCAYYNKKYKKWDAKFTSQGKRRFVGRFCNEHCAKAIALDAKDREFQRIYNSYINAKAKTTCRPRLVWTT